MENWQYIIQYYTIFKEVTTAAIGYLNFFIPYRFLFFFQCNANFFHLFSSFQKQLRQPKYKQKSNRNEDTSSQSTIVPDEDAEIPYDSKQISNAQEGLPSDGKMERKSVLERIRLPVSYDDLFEEGEIQEWTWCLFCKILWWPWIDFADLSCFLAVFIFFLEGTVSMAVLPVKVAEIFSFEINVHRVYILANFWIFSFSSLWEPEQSNIEFVLTASNIKFPVILIHLTISSLLLVS